MLVRVFSLRALALAFMMFACERGGIELVPEDGNEQAARVVFMDALARASQTPTNPASYAEFAQRVKELRPSLSAEIRADLSLRLMFLAMPALSGSLPPSRPEQTSLYANTVWPVVLRVPMTKHESASEYVARLCDQEPRFECADFTHGVQVDIMRARVFQRVHARARAAYAKCQECQKDPSYREALNGFGPLVMRAQARAAQARSATDDEPPNQASE